MYNIENLNISEDDKIFIKSNNNQYDFKSCIKLL